MIIKECPDQAETAWAYLRARDVFRAESIIIEKRRFFEGVQIVCNWPFARTTLPIGIPRKYTKCSICGGKPKLLSKTWVFSVIKSRRLVPFEPYEPLGSYGDYTACSESCRTVFTLAVL